MVHGRGVVNETSAPPPEDARFAVGQIVRHRLFGYRGVVVDVDATFKGTETWYRTMAKSHPPKDKPWYHVLVDGASYQTYVAERNLELDDSGEPIEHPWLDRFFYELRGGVYVGHRRNH